MGEGVKYIIPIAVYAAVVSLFITILSTTEALWASVGALLAIVSANDYVKHLYFYCLLTPVITGIDHIPTLLLNLSTLLPHLSAAR